MTALLATRPKRSVLQAIRPEDMEPPPGLRYFVVRLGGEGFGRHDRSVGGLDDEQLAWVARTVAAEEERRLSLPRPVQSAGGLQFVEVPKGLQFVFKF